MTSRDPGQMKKRARAMREKQQTVVYIERKQSHGCLYTVLAFLLFGWLGAAAMAVFKMLQVAWRWTLAVGWKLPVALVRATWQASVACVRWSVRGGKMLTARYGAKGWAVVGVVVVVLAILSLVFGRH